MKPNENNRYLRNDISRAINHTTEERLVKFKNYAIVKLDSY